MLKNVFPRSGYIQARDGSGHNIFYEVYGPQDAPATVMVHGNAGYVFDPARLRMWDLSRQRVVIMHARGIGKSFPAGDVGHNLYPDLADDIETLRAHLDLGRIALFGWSGGTAVSLLYAQTWPQNVRGLVLYGTYLGEAAEILSYYERIARIYPEGWRKFAAAYGTDDVDELLRRSSSRILSGSPEEKMQAVFQYELIFEKPEVTVEDLKARRSPHDWATALKNRMIFAAMMEKGYGLKPGQIEGRLSRLAHLPVCFVNGAEDYVTPPDTATRLAAQLPLARVLLVPGAGHDVHDSAVQNALRAIVINDPPSPRPPAP